MVSDCNCELDQITEQLIVESDFSSSPKLPHNHKIALNTRHQFNFAEAMNNNVTPINSTMNVTMNNPTHTEMHDAQNIVILDIQD